MKPVLSPIQSRHHRVGINDLWNRHASLVASYAKKPRTVWDRRQTIGDSEEAVERALATAIRDTQP